MVREQGTVEGLKDGKSMVRIERSSACATCESKASCHIEAGKELLVEVGNPIGAKEGDRVEVSMPTASVIKISAFVYIVPVAGLIAGAILGGWLTYLFQMGDNASRVIGGALGLGLSLALVIYFDRSVRSRPEYHPKMTRIIRKADGTPPSGDNR
jgi:sigma-E factor negative regulatory protein RseC